ncbi:LysM peptidoglycan-binding domain-containing protein [Promineifilum sp.]|uniref:LysM peptidoglycan-binding domain-containing protein n=1 Tax=Promineifilum sp. TaxID=2664178 RepID=UPI0035B0D6EB
MERERQQRHWQNNLIMTAGVMATVFFALVLAQLDALQARVLPSRAGLPIVNIQATAIAIGQIIPLGATGATGAPVAAPAAPLDEQNPRPDFITGVSESGAIFTVCGEVPEGWLLYTVQPGETLASLAAGTQSTEGDLAGANCLADGQLTAGMQILVPRQPAPALCGPPQWWVRYQAGPGDTLAALARSRGTTVDEVLRANCRDSLELTAGQWVFLPPGFQPGAPTGQPQPSLTPLPTATAVPTLVILPTATRPPADTPPPRPATPPTLPPPLPTPTTPVIISPPRPTATPPLPPTAIPPTEEPPTAVPPTAIPPTDAPPTDPPPTDPPPTDVPPTDAPPTATPPSLPTDSPPTEAAPTDAPPTAESTPETTEAPTPELTPGG